MATTTFKLTFTKPTAVFWFKQDGTKVPYTLPHDPQTDAIVADIHATDPEAVIMMHRESDGRIHLVPGQSVMTDATRNALMADVDAWLNGLDTARYTGKKDTVSFGAACVNGGCIAQPPKKSALNATLKAGTRAAILNWTQHAITPAPGTAPAGGTAPAPAGGTAPAPAGGTAPAPAGGTAPAPAGGTAPAPAGGTAPAPAGGTAPAPAGGTAPAPAGGTAPAPAGGTAPAPAPTGTADFIAGANRLRAAMESMYPDYTPASWTKGARLQRRPANNG